MAGSRYARVDTGYFSNPKIVDLTQYAKLLHLASILYCAEHLTDGAVTPAALRVCADRVGIRRDRRTQRCTELVAAGLWVETCDGWTLHDFVDMNPFATREVVDKQRERWRVQKANQRNGYDHMSTVDET